MRAVAAHAGQDPLRGAMLTSGATADNDNSSLVEFIVRANDGATLSIVQTNDAGFRTGDRIVIIRDDHARLGRPAAPAGR